MKSPINSDDQTQINLLVSDHHTLQVSFSDHDQPNEPNNNHRAINVPLLLQPSYVRSKSLIFDELRNFRISLKWCALDHSSCSGKFISYLTFIFLTIIVPLISSFSIKVPDSDSNPVSFNMLVQIPESGLALLGFFTLSRFFSKYGLRQLLFLDGLQQDSLFIRRGYTKELDKAFRYLACILLPSFFVELAHKIIFFSTVDVSLPYISSGVPLNSIMFVFVLVSWVYRTGVYLLVCIMFRLTCELQILRFGGLHKKFEGRESDIAGRIFKEHMRIKKQLSATSHRYRFFIIASLVVISVSQLGCLVLILATNSDKSFFNAGDLVVCSAVELSGFLLCLLGAARITHRAQGIASVATRWHMTVTCAGSDRRKSNCTAEADVKCGDIDDDDDSDSSSDILITVSPQDSSSFHTRQALVAYLEHNNGGITLFGFALDRGLLHTIFAFEFSLVLWILSKVVVLSN
ncbi:hypothetical protein Dsin_016242 [Dipteronia sinensis]|uniref:Uncharacterized protein n=1 Tax=Dipteronia sinensis TaxID=43782 RepID=A0AAE0E5B1_9ROSI|nr:hypothetical protein Dsin_016242 [Dipteronia sinensis]